MAFPTPPVETGIKSIHTSDRKGRKPTIIVIHHTAGTDSLNYLTKNVNKVSTHALINKQGRIYRMVPDELAANTVGFSAIGTYNRWPTLKGTFSCNIISLNIELENLGNGRDPYPEAQVNAAAWQIASWRRKYGYLFVLSHAVIDTNGKTDPLGFNWNQLETMIAYHTAFPS